jgi:hypothetical protein
VLSTSGVKKYSIVPNFGGKPGENIIMISDKKMDLPPGSTVNSLRLKMMKEAENYSPGGFSRGNHRQYFRKSKYDISDSSSLESAAPKRIDSLQQFSRADSNVFSKSKTLVDR